MPTSEREKEILFHEPTDLKQTPDSADPQKRPAPPSKRVVRPSVDSLSDVISHQPGSHLPPVRSPQPPTSAPAPPVGQTDDARAEFAAATARARAAVAQQQTAKSNAAARQAAPVAPQAQAVPAPAPAQVPVERQPIPERRMPTEPSAAIPVQAPPPATPAPRPPLEQQAAPQTAPQESPTPEPQRARVTVEQEPAPQAPPEQRQKRASGTSFLLHTHDLKKVYDGRAVVDGVEVTVRPSEIVGLLGPNGAGKTTTFYMIVGLIQPNGGRVTFNGKDATNEPMYRRARLGMGYLPQEESIFRKLSVEDNILAVMETQNIPRSERRDRCHELMKSFGIEKLARHEAITLSGGEKRRLTIARSLVTNPKLLMLDEPFSGVDPIAVGEIQEIVRNLREQGLAILITDHNVRETLDIVDRAYLLFEGRVEREGTRDFLINDPLSRQLYLGERFSM